MNSSNLGLIHPGIGIDGICLGFSRRRVKKILGSPEESFTALYQEGAAYERFAYPSLGLTFEFIEFGLHRHFSNHDDPCSLQSIRVEREDMTINGVLVSGISVNDLTEFLKLNPEYPEPSVAKVGSDWETFAFPLHGLLSTSLIFRDGKLSEVKLGGI
jgi:hypothetical protein